MAGGRPPGSRNKTASNAKGAIEQCFEEMGGILNLVMWAKENQTDFYKTIYPKLLPLTVGSDPENPLVVISEIRRTIIDTQPADTQGT